LVKVMGLAVYPRSVDVRALLARKTHPSWARFTDGAVSREGLLLHYRHELAITLRPYPRLLALVARRAPADARAFLEETIADERDHEALFMRTMRALGFGSLEGPLLPEGEAYLSFLEQVAVDDWIHGFAVLALFVDGSTHAPMAPDQIERRIRAHPLVRWYGVPPSEMEAARAHLRKPRAPWGVWAVHECESAFEKMNEALERWLAFRAAIGARW
jgi:pyrroloquinoline-quinone synthase